MDYYHIVKCEKIYYKNQKGLDCRLYDSMMGYNINLIKKTSNKKRIALVLNIP